MKDRLSGLIERWNSNTIPRKSKGELVAKFQTTTGRNDNNRRFYNILTRMVQPTPDELDLLEGLINKYYEHHLQLSQHEA